MLKYNDFITEGKNDSFLELLNESLTYITDEWTEWTFEVLKLTTSVYSIKFVGIANFQDLKELIVRLDSIKSHLGEDIVDFKFDISYGDGNLELGIRVGFIRQKNSKDKKINISEIISLDQEDDELTINVEYLEDYLTQKSGYDFKYLENNGEKEITFLVEIPGIFSKKTEEDKFCSKMDKVLEIFDVDKLPTDIQQIPYENCLVEYGIDFSNSSDVILFVITFRTSTWVNFNI